MERVCPKITFIEILKIKLTEVEHLDEFEGVRPNVMQLYDEHDIAHENEREEKLGCYCYYSPCYCCFLFLYSFDNNNNNNNYLEEDKVLDRSIVEFVEGTALAEQRHPEYLKNIFLIKQ